MSAVNSPGRAADNVITGENHARAIERENTWRLEPHVCRNCFGRITSTKAADGGRTYQCTNCGLTGHGHKADTVCACGIKMRKYRGDGRSSVTMVDAGIRCHPNKRVSPEFPSLFTASYGGAQAEDA